MEEKDTVMTTSATTAAAAAAAAAAESNKVNGQQDDYTNNKADPNNNNNVNNNNYDDDNAAAVNVNMNVSSKKPRLLPPLPLPPHKLPPPPHKLPLPPLLDEEERLTTIQKWIAQPIDKLRDVTTGIFQDPYPASIIIENNTNRNDNNIDDNDEDDNNYDNTGILIGNKYHASDIQHLLQLGVTAVLNCASGGIAQLPVEELKQNGIIYGFTNVRQDDLKYPILHELVLPPSSKGGTEDNTNGTTPPLKPLIPSQHLKVAKTMYIEEVLKKKGKILFFCVAGQNRSATLALSVLLLHGKYDLNILCQSCYLTRSFVLENLGFQKQLIQLEYYLLCQKATKKDGMNNKKSVRKRYGNGKGMTMYSHGDYTDDDAVLAANKGNMIMTRTMSYDDSIASSSCQSSMPRSTSQQSFTRIAPTTPNGLLITTTGEATTTDATRTTTNDTRKYVEIELLIPGLCTMEAYIPVPSTIIEVKKILVDYANTYLLKSEQRTVAKSWIVLATFGHNPMYDLPLEDEAIEKSIQLYRLENMFHLKTAAAEITKPTTATTATETTETTTTTVQVPVVVGATKNANNNDTSTKNVGADTATPSSSQVVDNNDRIVFWTSKCRFALVIFSVYTGSSSSGEDEDTNNDDDATNKCTTTSRRYQEPWTFQHQERPGAPATLLANTLISTHLRGWDFCDGQAYASKEPIVFSFSPEGASDKRQFMKISTCSQESQQFEAPGEGGILGMGANAIVHRVELQSTSPKSFASTTTRIDTTTNTEERKEKEEEQELFWDAAVKRPFSLSKMLSSLKSSSEAGLAKRLRLLAHSSLLNSDGRVLYFYGLGVALSSNAYQPTEYKFEACILARYEEEFSTYTMKKFMIDYTSTITTPPPITPLLPSSATATDNDWRKDFSLISVKVLLVSLLNAFRDLTLMGVQAFDFNHLGNVLVSRDHQSVKLLDIDGDSRGSIQLSEYMINNNSSDNGGGNGGEHSSNKTTVSRRPSILLHKPSLDIDLNAVLPTVVQQLLLGKGRGTGFVVDTKSMIWRLPPIEAKELIGKTVNENFGPLTDSHMAKVVEWFYAMLKKQPPWGNWTHDIYDAMRCIDHLPIR